MQILFSYKGKIKNLKSALEAAINLEKTKKNATGAVTPEALSVIQKF